MSATYPFRKMNGLGNDFVVLDQRVRTLALDETLTRAIGDRETGIGFDQLLTIEPPRADGDVFMGILNSDGSVVEACGNGARCIAYLLCEETGRDRVTLETLGGRLVAWRAGPQTMTVDMGAPHLAAREIPLSIETEDTIWVALDAPVAGLTLPPLVAVNMGNPHAIFFVENVASIPLEHVGPALETHPLFPARANISFVQEVGPDHFKARVWERGAGATRACGTAACAIGVAAIRRGLAHSPVTVELPGGPLTIDWRAEDGHVLMTGAVAHDYDGDLDPADFIAKGQAPA